jgi:hypothetical protein
MPIRSLKISGRRVVNSAPALIFDDKTQRMIDEMIAAEARHLIQGQVVRIAL